MTSLGKHLLLFSGLLFSMMCAACAAAMAADSNPEELIARHLQSIASAEVRNGVKSRVVEGTVTYKTLVGGAGQTNGKAVLVSEQRKFNLLLKLLASDYRGEQFVSDGNRISVAGTLTDKRRSDFGDFLLAQDAPLREGLIGGVLSTAWPLHDLQARKAGTSFEGTKVVDGKQVEVLRYRPQKKTDLQIMLYFDPETARHVKTVYTATQQPTVRRSDIESARAGMTRYRIEEDFSEFQTIDGFTLPSHYELRFSEELENTSSTTILWSVVLNKILNNVSLDPRNFEVK